METTYNYMIYPPFIDAYENSFFNKKYLTINEIKNKLIGYAVDWGSEIPSYSELHGYSSNPPILNDKYILACGSVFDKNSDSFETFKQLLVGVDIDKFDGDWWNHLEVFEGEIDPAWNVT